MFKSRAVQRLIGADPDTREVLIGSAVAFVMKALAAVAVFGLNVVVARQLGASQAGLFFLSFTFVVIASGFSRLGLDDTFVRFIASFRASDDWGHIRGLHRTALLWAVLTSLAVSILLYLAAQPMSERLFNEPELADVLRAMAFAIPLVTVYTLQAKALQGLKRVSESLAVLSVLTPLLVVILSLLLWPIWAAQTAWLYVTGTAFTTLIAIWLWRRAMCLPPSTLPVISTERSVVLASCLPLLAVTMLNYAVSWSSQLLLGVWSTSADVAAFSAAQRTALLTSFVLVAVNSIAAPKFAAMYRLAQYDALRRTAIHSTRLMVALATLPLLLMLTIPAPLLTVFGPEFTSAAMSLQILAVGQFINVATGSVGYLLIMSGHERLLRNNVLAAASVAVGLGLLLIPQYGMLGGAIATATGSALQNLLSVVQVRRVLGFNTLAIWRAT